MTQILFVLLPPLVERGQASFDGAWFVLISEFGDDPVDRLHNVMAAIPSNVVRWYQDDLYSPKMVPLFDRFLGEENDNIIKHEMILLQIVKRQNRWKENVQRYIHENHRRSFYLGDVNRKLREQYKYSFASAQELKDLEYLIKMVTTKHVHGVKKPKIKAVRKVPDVVLPERGDTTSGDIEQGDCSGHGGPPR